jgi:hypothetical protein
MHLAMIRKITLSIFISVLASQSYSQDFRLKELTYLFNQPIQMISTVIDEGRWVEQYNQTSATYSIKLAQWRYIGNVLGKPQRTIIKVSAPPNQIPKMLMFVTQEAKTIKEVGKAINELNLKVRETANNNNLIHKTYYYNNYLLVYSYNQESAIVLLSSLKEHLNELKRVKQIRKGDTRDIILGPDGKVIH